MMPVIRISDDVMDMLKKFAVPLEDTPDSVLRRILMDYRHIKKIEEPGNRVTSQGKDDLHEKFSRSAHSIAFTRPRAVPRGISGIKFPRPHTARCGRWIVAALTSLGGSVSAEEVISYIQKVFGREFTERDRGILSSGEIRWVKNVHWARYDMVMGGLLKKKEDVPHGVWELTEKGKNFYK
jgi:hypothetical protein